MKEKETEWKQRCSLRWWRKGNRRGEKQGVPESDEEKERKSEKQGCSSRWWRRERERHIPTPGDCHSFPHSVLTKAEPVIQLSEQHQDSLNITNIKQKSVDWAPSWCCLLEFTKLESFFSRSLSSTHNNVRCFCYLAGPVSLCVTHTHRETERENRWDRRDLQSHTWEQFDWTSAAYLRPLSPPHPACSPTPSSLQNVQEDRRRRKTQQQVKKKTSQTLAEV
jgi:hypothetical protein